MTPRTNTNSRHDRRARGRQPEKAQHRLDKKAYPFTRPELAALMGVHPLTISKWEKESPGLPVEERGAPGRASKYNLADAVGWYMAKAGRNGDGLSLTDETAKLRRAYTEKVDLEVRTRRGELISREQAVREGQGYTRAIRARLLALHHQLGQLGIVAPERLVEVRTLVLDMLGEMSRWSFADVEALADAHPKPPDAVEGDCPPATKSKGAST